MCFGHVSRFVALDRSAGPLHSRSHGGPSTARVGASGGLYMPGSAAAGLTFTPPLIFERGAKGRTGASLPAPEVPQVDPAALYGDLFRKQQPGLAEVSEPEAVRHYVQLSQQNFAIDTGMYPLGHQPRQLRAQRLHRRALPRGRARHRAARAAGALRG